MAEPDNLYERADPAIMIPIIEETIVVHTQRSIMGNITLSPLAPLDPIRDTAMLAAYLTTALDAESGQRLTDRLLMYWGTTLPPQLIRFTAPNIPQPSPIERPRRQKKRILEVSPTNDNPSTDE